MKRKISIILVLVMTLSMIFSVNVAAARKQEMKLTDILKFQYLKME